jgi:hypothetical protein
MLHLLEENKSVGVTGVVGAALVAIMVNRKRNNGANQALKDFIMADGVETEHQYAAFALRKQICKLLCTKLSRISSCNECPCPFQIVFSSNLWQKK